MISIKQQLISIQTKQNTKNLKLINKKISDQF